MWRPLYRAAPCPVLRDGPYPVPPRRRAGRPTVARGCCPGKSSRPLEPSRHYPARVGIPDEVRRALASLWAFTPPRPLGGAFGRASEAAREGHAVRSRAQISKTASSASFLQGRISDPLRLAIDTAGRSFQPTLFPGTFRHIGDIIV